MYKRQGPGHVKMRTLNGGVELLVPLNDKIRQFVFTKGVDVYKRQEYETIQQAIPEEKVYDPAVPVYHEGDTVYLENLEYQITELRERCV